MKIIVIVYTFFSFFILISCNRGINDVKMLLTDRESKRWILEEYTSSYGNKKKLNIRIMEFKIDSSIFIYKYEKGKISLFEDKHSDIISTNKWYLKNDSLININNSDYKIIKLNDDSLFIVNIPDNTKFLYLNFN